jgi:hypothetical protein
MTPQTPRSQRVRRLLGIGTTALVILGFVGVVVLAIALHS